jgi:hypothetical protein
VPPEANADADGTTTEGAKAQEDKAQKGILADLARERTARQAAEAKATALEAAQTAAAEEAAKKAGEHKALYDGLKPKYDEATAKLTAWETREAARVAALTARNAARIAALPEDFRELVPEGLDPDTATAQIEKLEARARKADPKLAQGGAAGIAAGGKPNIPDECKAEAAENKRDPQWWFDNVWNSPRAMKRRAAAKT